MAKTVNTYTTITKSRDCQIIYVHRIWLQIQGIVQTCTDLYRLVWTCITALCINHTDWLNVNNEKMHCKPLPTIIKDEKPLKYHAW